MRTSQVLAYKLILLYYPKGWSSLSTKLWQPSIRSNSNLYAWFSLISFFILHLWFPTFNLYRHNETSYVTINLYHDLYDMQFVGRKTFQLNQLIAKLPILTMWKECNKNYMCSNLWPNIFSFIWPHYWTLMLVHFKS